MFEERKDMKWGLKQQNPLHDWEREGGCGKLKTEADSGLFV